MYKEIEIKGLVTKRTFIEVDEQAINQIKSIHENKDVKWIEEVELWIEEVEFFGGLFFDAKDQNEFIHVTRQGIDLLAAEYTIKGVATREFDSKTPVQQVKTIADAYKGKYVAVEIWTGFGLFHGNIKCEEYDMSKLKFPLEYWKCTDDKLIIPYESWMRTDDELISCDTVIYDGEVYKLAADNLHEECVEYVIGKFNDDGCFERFFYICVR
jgi:hypothetical protein